mmetsp:Transcript_21733/g.45285  ORF Transcript_21733/g.45285 Transcript_21733/m.45285 type:complete len:210 (+) Transcript_21733:74-703(+)
MQFHAILLLLLLLTIEGFTEPTKVAFQPPKASILKVSVPYEGITAENVFGTASDLEKMSKWVRILEVNVDTQATNPRLPPKVSIWRVTSPLRRVPRRLLSIVPSRIADVDEWTWLAESEKDETLKTLTWKTLPIDSSIAEGNVNLPNNGSITVDGEERKLRFEMKIAIWLPRLVVKVVERLVLRRELKSLVKFAKEFEEEEERVRMSLR